VQGVSLILHQDQKCAVLGITCLRLCDLKASLSAMSCGLSPLPCPLDYLPLWLSQGFPIVRDLPTAALQMHAMFSCLARTHIKYALTTY
jgi:hypothetical protein